MKIALVRKNGVCGDWDVVSVLDNEWIDRNAPEWKTLGFYRPQNENDVEMNIEIPDNSLVQAPFVSEAGSAVRYLRDGTDFYPAEPRPLYRVKKDKLSEIAEARWKNETGGLTVQGMTIDTSRESQALITGAALQATLDPTYTCHWKTAGGFVNLTAANVLAVAVAARQHVQGYFDREAELSARVEEATTVGEVQAIVWDEEPEDSEEAVEV